MAKDIFGVDIDLSNNQLLNASLQNLATHPSTVGKTAGYIYWNTSDVTAYIFTGVANTWIDLGNTLIGALNPILSGATVLASLTTNASGHITAATTRILTLADLGYTGALDANKYIHPTFGGNSLAGPLTGAVVISNVSTNTEGHVTGFATRSLTAADISTWTTVEIQTRLDAINSTITGGLVNKGSYNAATNTPLLDATPIAGIKNGWTYVITAAGLFFTENVQVGDMIIANQDNPTLLSHWTVVNKNIPDIVQASETVLGILQLATTTEAIAGTDALKAITPATLKAVLDSRTGGYAANFGNASATSFDITHGLNAIDLVVEIVENSTGQTVRMQVRRTNTSTVNIQCNIPPTTNQYRVVIKK